MRHFSGVYRDYWLLIMSDIVALLPRPRPRPPLVLPVSAARPPPVAAPRRPRPRPGARGAALDGVLLPAGLGRRFRPLLARRRDPVHDDARLRRSGREQFRHLLLDVSLQMNEHLGVTGVRGCRATILQLTHLDVDRNPREASVEPLQALDEVSAELPNCYGFAAAGPDVDLLQGHEQKKRAHMKTDPQVRAGNAFRSGNEYG